jgi:hypothetical protein
MRALDERGCLGDDLAVDGDFQSRIGLHQQPPSAKFDRRSASPWQPEEAGEPIPAKRQQTLTGDRLNDDFAVVDGLVFDELDTTMEASVEDTDLARLLSTSSQ